MKVLMLQGYYEPEIASGLHLTTDLIEDLIKEKYEVDVITPIPTRGITDEVRNKYKSLKIEYKYNGNLRVHRYWLPKENKKTITRAIRYIVGGVIQVVKSLKVDTDIIIITSTPPINGIIAAFLKKIKKVPILYVLQDIFPDSLVTTNLTKEGSIIWKIGSIIEKITYKNSDNIIVISEDFKDNLKRKNVLENKINVIYNWIDDNKIKPIKRSENELIKKLNIDESGFYVVYAGNLGNAQNIDIILNIAKQTEDKPNLKYLIFGNGVQEEYYKNMAKEMCIENIKFYPLQPYELVSHVYSLADVSIVPCKSGFGGSAMPSKTWTIMSSGTAVIANFDAGTELQRIIESNEIGIFTKSGDEIALKKAILKLYSDRILCETMGINARKYIEINLSRNLQTKKYIETIKSLVGEKYNV